MCTGRIDPQFILKAFEQGADAVLILGCHPGDCHYKEQNYRNDPAALDLPCASCGSFGIEEERCRLDFVSAAEGEKYATVVRDMVESINELGHRIDQQRNKQQPKTPIMATIEKDLKGLSAPYPHFNSAGCLL